MFSVYAFVRELAFGGAYWPHLEEFAYHDHQVSEFINILPNVCDEEKLELFRPWHFAHAIRTPIFSCIGASVSV